MTPESLRTRQAAAVWPSARRACGRRDSPGAETIEPLIRLHHTHYIFPSPTFLPRNPQAERASLCLRHPSRHCLPTSKKTLVSALSFSGVDGPRTLYSPDF